MNPQILQDLKAFYPEITLTLTLLAVIVIDLAAPRIRQATTFLLSALGLLMALGFCFPLFNAPAGTLFYGMVALDPMAVFFKVFLILTSFLILLAAPGSKEIAKQHIGEFYTLLLGVTLAMVLLASAVDMLMLFLSLEMVSLSSYIMVGYLSNERQSNEASLKYLLFGAVSTGSMLYGITLALRPDRNHQNGSDPGCHRPWGGKRQQRCHAADRDRAHHRRFRLQDRLGALPLLVPRRLHRRSNAGDRLPERGAQSGRLCHPDPFLFHGPFGHFRRRTLGIPSGHELGGAGADDFDHHDDARQHCRAAPGKHQTHARLFLHRSCRLHSDGGGRADVPGAAVGS